MTTNEMQSVSDQSLSGTCEIEPDAFVKQGLVGRQNRDPGVVLKDGQQPAEARAVARGGQAVSNFCQHPRRGDDFVAQVLEHGPLPDRAIRPRA